jgi:tRNA A58 N-methylase Trm61
MLLNTKRNTQILYPKDIGYILITLGIGPGCRVIEAGTGSGGLTQALAFMWGIAVMSTATRTGRKCRISPGRILLYYNYRNG